MDVRILIIVFSIVFDLMVCLLMFYIYKKDKRKNELYTVKLKEAICIDGNGYIIEAKEKRYNNVNIKKLLPFLMQNDYIFQRRIDNNKVIKNNKYIEIFIDIGEFEKKDKLRNYIYKNCIKRGERINV